MPGSSGRAHSVWVKFASGPRSHRVRDRGPCLLDQAVDEPRNMTTVAQPRHPTARPDDTDPALVSSLRLSGVLAAVAAAACLANLFVPGLLSGPDVMNGSAKGTSLVALVVAVPLLAVAAWRAGVGSFRALVVTTGVTAYLLYNSVLFLFGTPFNQAFLLYVAMLGLAVWTLAALIVALWSRVARARGRRAAVGPGVRVVDVLLNGAAWLARVLPAMLDEDPTDWLAGTGLTTNPVIAQDLAFWLPVMAWLGWGVWKARPPACGVGCGGPGVLGRGVPWGCGRPVVGPPGGPLVDLGSGRSGPDVRGPGVDRPAAHVPVAAVGSRRRRSLEQL